jgi:hypothetical protein
VSTAPSGSLQSDALSFAVSDQAQQDERLISSPQTTINEVPAYLVDTSWGVESLETQPIYQQASVEACNGQLYTVFGYNQSRYDSSFWNAIKSSL